MKLRCLDLKNIEPFVKNIDVADIEIRDPWNTSLGGLDLHMYIKSSEHPIRNPVTIRDLYVDSYPWSQLSILLRHF